MTGLPLGPVVDRGPWGTRTSTLEREDPELPNCGDREEGRGGDPETGEGRREEGRWLWKRVTATRQECVWTGLRPRGRPRRYKREGREGRTEGPEGRELTPRSEELREDVPLVERGKDGTGAGEGRETSRPTWGGWTRGLWGRGTGGGDWDGYFGREDCGDVRRSDGGRAGESGLAPGTSEPGLVGGLSNEEAPDTVHSRVE